MPGVLFVCTANQFRSPIAAAYFSKKLLDSEKSQDWNVSSAGTWTSVGLSAHPSALSSASKIGLDLSTHRTLEVNKELLNEFDLIVVMEHNHKEALEIEFPFVRKKIVLLGEIAKIPGGEIPDPAKDEFVDSTEIVNLIISAIDASFSKIQKLALINQN